MKINRLGILFLFVGMAGVIVYQYRLNRQLTLFNNQYVFTAAGSVGHLIDVLAVLKLDQSEYGRKAMVETREALIPLGLVLVTTPLEMESLNADAFAGLCKLVANADALFPLREGNQIEKLANGFLISRLRSIEGNVKNESMMRSLRFGDQHRCDLQRHPLEKPAD
jgi:hypothetical protein